MAMKIDDTQCTNCAMCEPVCPTEAVKEKGGVFFIDADTCTECEGEADGPQCVDACPVDDCIVLK